jgi:hypothetical protein
MLMLFAVTLTLNAFTVFDGYSRVKAAFKRGLDVGRARVIHRFLKLVKRIVPDQIKVGRGLNLVGENDDNAHPAGTRLRTEILYPHIIPGNLPSYLNHLSGVLLRMLIQLTKRCFNRQIGSRAAESAATQDHNRKKSRISFILVSPVAAFF